ncbi:MAG: hypothetical protein NVS3B20_05270 [Polyangiales bacterium]
MSDAKLATNEVSFEIAIRIPPGTVSADRNRALDRTLSARLHDEAKALQVFLVAKPSAYARELFGKDSEGNTRFVVRGRVEGDHLVPIKKAPPR